MRRRLPILFALVLTACAAVAQPPPIPLPSPTREWATQREALTAANVVFLVASSRCEISDEQRLVYGTILATAAAELEKAEALLPEGGERFRRHIGRASSSLERFMEHGRH